MLNIKQINTKIYGLYAFRLILHRNNGESLVCCDKSLFSSICSVINYIYFIYLYLTFQISSLIHDKTGFSNKLQMARLGIKTTQRR